jgi:Kef-type K+ transport system membrane component KefB
MDGASPVPKRRLAVYFALLAVLAAVATAGVLSLGADEQAEKQIAGGYDVTVANPCLGKAGQQFDIKQSGRFVTMESNGSGPSGKLEVRDGRLSGDVECVDGGKAPIDARVQGESLRGTVGGRPAAAELRREPPAPGTQKPDPPNSIAGEYAVSPRSMCLGGAIKLSGDGPYVLSAGERKAGKVAYERGKLTGVVKCAKGPAVKLTGEAAGRQITITVGAEKVSATKKRQFESTLGAFFIAVAIVMLFARLMGALMLKIGQPRVMGEVLAGILLGPTLFARVAPDLQAAIFPSDIIPYIGVAANLGLIFYMFLIGLEIDLSQLRGRMSQAVAISNTGVLIPMVAGMLVALPIYERLGPDKGFVGFALFMGVSMSITAFPVLARILAERRMLKRPVGALALASAAIDDVTAWFLIALATAVAVAGNAAEVVKTIALAIAFTAVMFLVVRRILARASVAYDEAGRVPSAWIAAIFAGVLVSAFLTEEIGIAVIFGAFVMGAIMPRHAGLTEDVTHRVEDFVVTLLLPLFFAYTGLKTNLFLLDRLDLVVITLVLLVVAIVCKFGGTMIAARVTNMSWRESAVLGTLMNTRGLTELIVLNLALEKGVISEALFAALVIMALVTTFMTGPILRLLDPKNEFGAPVDEELEEARRESLASSPIPVPEHAILLAPQTDAALPQLLALAEPLAASEPPRELILVRVMRPPRGAQVRGALQTENRQLTETSTALAKVRMGLLERGIVARAVALTSVHPGQDIVALDDREEVDLVIVDGRRPLLGPGVPRGDVGTILAKAPSDVAVLVAREDEVIAPGPDRPVIVPFGGADHDWAALELGAWLASANDAPLKLLGVPGQTEGGRDVTSLLANASLLLQQFAGLHAEPVVAEAGREGIATAAEGAGLLVVGLSERWRNEGLGELRRRIAHDAPAPILFVRRGLRAGALAPKDDVTRFTWSSPAMRGIPATPRRPAS